MAERIGERLTHGEQRVQRLVDPLEPSRLDVPRDRDRLQHEAFGPPQKVEHMAAKLPVIEELRAIGATEPSDLEQTLRIVGLQAFRTTEQDRRRAKQRSGAKQSKPLQQLRGIARSGILETAATNRLLHGDDDLVRIQVGDRERRRRLDLPPLLAVESLEQDGVVLVATQFVIGAADATICAPAVRVRTTAPPGDRNHENFAPVRYRHALDAGEGRRIDVVQLLHELLDGLVADVLPDHRPIGLYADEDLPAAIVQHGADGLGHVGALPGRALELQHLGFAGGGERAHDISVHAVNAPQFGH